MVAAAIVGSAVVGAAATTVASNESADASDRAAESQANATRSELDFQRYIFEQQRADQEPWRETGIEALETIRTGVADGRYDPGNFDFEADPGYEFRLQEGNKAFDRSAASRGMLLSGAQLKSLSRYNQDVASDEYQNAFNRDLVTRETRFNQAASLAGVGQIANQQVNDARETYAQASSAANARNAAAQQQNAINQGNIRAQQTQAYAQTANQGINNYLTYQAVSGG